MCKLVEKFSLLSTSVTQRKNEYDERHILIIQASCYKMSVSLLPYDHLLQNYNSFNIQSEY